MKTLSFGEKKPLRLHRDVLNNGLRVYVLRDTTAPVVSSHLWYRVGSRHERPGKTGLAHLFEHLMFGPTTQHPAGEFDKLLEAEGAESNAATWTDWTHYYANVPRKGLPVVLKLEADRMTNLILREAEVRSEKDVVINERRLRVEDDVNGRSCEHLYKTAYRKHAYRWPTIGWMRDIRGFNIEDCQRFYQDYYAPNNATLVIVGDVVVKRVFDLVEQSFGHIPRSQIPKTMAVVEPQQRKERRVQLCLPSATEMLTLGYHGPAIGDPDSIACALLSEVLAGGRLGRMYRALVRGASVASDVGASMVPFVEPGLFEIEIDMRHGVRATDGLAHLDALIAHLCTEPILENEFTRVCNRMELAALHGLETASGKAEKIGFYDTVTGNPCAFFDRLKAFRSLDLEDVRRVAKQVLNPAKRTVITVIPEELRELEELKKMEQAS